MRTHFAPLLLLVLAASIVSVDCSCSRQSRTRRALAKANEEYAAGRYDQAEIEYKNVLQSGGLNPEALGRLGAIYRAEGRVGQSLPLLGKAKELRPDDPEIRLNLGIALLAAGNPAAARAEAIAVLERKPLDAQAPLLLAECATTPQEIAAARERLSALPDARTRAPVLVALGQLERRANRTGSAQALFERALEVDPKYPNAHGALAMIYWSRNDLAAAEKAFKRAAELAPARSPLRLQYAEFKLHTGAIAESKVLFEKISQETPDFLPAWMWRAEIAASEKDYDAAESLVATALARDAYHPELMVLSARVWLAKGDNDRAVTELEKVTTFYPRIPIAYYLLGRAYAAKGELSTAAENYNRAIGMAADYAPPVIALAELNMRRGSFDATIAGLKPLLVKHPENIAGHLLLAEAYAARGSFDEALAVYRTVEQRYPNNGQTPYYRGVVLRQQGRRAEARAAFLRAAELNPDALSPIEPLVDMDLEDKAYDAALARTEAMVARQPKAAAPLILLSRVHLAQGKANEAAGDLQKATAVDPESSAALLALAELDIRNHHEVSAIAELRKAVAKNPKNAGALVLIGVLESSRKDYAKARDAYEQALLLQPRSTIAINNLAYLYSENLGQLDRAYELAQRGRTLRPDDPRTADTLGWIMYRRGMYPQALALLQESTPKLPNESEAQFHLGMAYYMVGDEAQARLALEKSLAGQTAPERAEVARQKLAVLALPRRGISAEQVPALEKIVAQQPNDPAAELRLASAYEAARNLPKARAAAEAAMKASPKNPAASVALARIRADEGDLGAAVEIAKAARSTSPDDPDVAHVLGELVFRQGQHRWAAGLLREAADKRGSDPEVLFDLANATYSIGLVDDARRAIQRSLDAGLAPAEAAQARQFLSLVGSLSATPDAATVSRAESLLKSDPANVPALMVAARADEAKPDWKAAQRTYEQVLARYPEFGPAQKGLAIALSVTGSDLAKAAAVATKARQAYPSDPDLAKAFGLITYRQGDYARAVTLFEESAMTRATDAELMYYLGMSQLQLKRKAASKQTLQKALDLGLTGELAAQAKKSVASAD